MIKKTPLKNRSRCVSDARQQFSRSLFPLTTAIDECLPITVESLPSFQAELHRQKHLLALAERKILQQQQQLQAAHQKSDQQTTLLKQLQTQLHSAQQMENMGLLVGKIVHDLNNVLSPILSLAQVLRLHQPTLDAGAQERLQLIEKSAKRGANMLQQLLAAGQFTSQEHSPVAIAPLLQEVINVVQATFPDTISIRHSISRQPRWFIAADATHIHQILMNLCVNARDAMPCGGVLTLAIEDGLVDQAAGQNSLKAQGCHYVVMTITDTGAGIPFEWRDRIFEPFFTTKPPGQGTGLGLVTVSEIVKQYGGFLRFSSEVGKGTSVQVFLPVIAEPAPAIP